MQLSKIKKTILLSTAITFFSSAFSIAQVVAPQQAPQQQELKAEYSEETLVKFISVNKDMNVIQKQGEQNMIKTIEEKEMDVQTFQKIAQMNQNPDAPKSDDITEEQLKTFQELMPQIQAIQVKVQAEMKVAIENNEMKVEEYQEIMMAYQKSPELQQKISEIMMKNEESN